MYDAGTFNLVWYGNANDHPRRHEQVLLQWPADDGHEQKIRRLPDVRRRHGPRDGLRPFFDPTWNIRRAASTRPTRRPSRPASASGTTTVYTSYDTSCPEAGIDHANKEINMNACLAKGDKVFLFNNRVDADGNAGYGDANGHRDRAGHQPRS